MRQKVGMHALPSLFSDAFLGVSVIRVWEPKDQGERVRKGSEMWKRSPHVPSCSIGLAQALGTITGQGAGKTCSCPPLPSASPSVPLPHARAHWREKLVMALGLSLLVFAGYEHPLSTRLVFTWWGDTSLCSLEDPAAPPQLHTSLMWEDPLSLKHFSF